MPKKRPITGRRRTQIRKRNAITESHFAFGQQTSPEFKKIYLETVNDPRTMSAIRRANKKDQSEAGKLRQEKLAFGRPNTAWEMLRNIIEVKYLMRSTGIRDARKIKKAIQIEDAIAAEKENWIRGPSKKYLALIAKLEKLIGRREANWFGPTLRDVRFELQVIRIKS